MEQALLDFQMNGKESYKIHGSLSLRWDDIIDCIRWYDDQRKWMPSLLNSINNFRKSSMPNLEVLCMPQFNLFKMFIIYSLKSLIFSLLPFSGSSSSSISSYFSSFCSSMSILPNYSIKFLSFFNSSENFYLFSIKSWITFLCLKFAWRVLFFLVKHILNRPSHSI